MSARVALLFGIFLPALAGCNWFGPSAPAGTVTGVVLVNGEPAAGKRISLVPGERRAVTNAGGRYTFTGVGAGRYTVSFVSNGDRAEVVPNEVASWQSLPIELAAGSGKEVPAFDVAYNGLLYPDVGMSLIVKTTSPVPFHWSLHPQAANYRLVLRSEGDSSFKFASPWAKEAWATYAADVAPGRYKWQVEIDGAESGIGLSRDRQVDF